MKSKLFPMFVGFFVISSGAIGYQISSSSIDLANETKQMNTESAALRAAAQQRLTPKQKDFHQCVSTYSVLLQDAQKYGSLATVSKRKSDLRDCDVILR